MLIKQPFMKKCFSTFLLMILVSIYVNAQSFTGGAQVGLSACQIDGDSQGGYHKVGGYLGGFVGRDISDMFSWQFEMRYIQKGAFNWGTKGQLKINYGEFPLLVHCKYWEIIFEGGVVPGVLLSAKSVSMSKLEYDLDTYKKVSMDLLFGVRYPINNKVAIVSRFGYSMIPISSISNRYTNRRQYNKYLTFGIHYLLVK